MLLNSLDMLGQLFNSQSRYWKNSHTIFPYWRHNRNRGSFNVTTFSDDTQLHQSPKENCSFGGKWEKFCEVIHVERGPAESLNKVALRILGLAMEGKQGRSREGQRTPWSQNSEISIPLGNIFNNYCFHQQNGLRGIAPPLKLQIKKR